MSEEDVVVSEPNPTNEDLSIDVALNDLYESTEEASTEAEVETKVEAIAEVSESDEVAESTESEEGTDESEEGEFSLPENMPKELQESISSLDEGVQRQSVEVFKKMQGSFTKKNQEFAEQKKLADNITQAFNNSGLNVSNPEAVVNKYIAFERLIKSDPKAAIQNLMDYTKMKPEDLGSTPTKSSDDEYLTDEEKNNRKQNETLQQRIYQLEQNAANSKDQAQQTVVDGFRNKTNEAGELVNPHFDAVKADMMDLADINPGLTIDKLYTKAVRNNDELYKKDMEAEIERRIGAKESKRKAEVEKAKKMNGQSLRTGSPNTKVVDGDAMFEQLAASAGWN